MVEKSIRLDGISLVDFLGVENENIKKIEEAFPTSKITSRGDEIHIEGPTSVLIRVNDIIESLKTHYETHRKITKENVEDLLKDKKIKSFGSDDHVILYGTHGNAIKPTSENQQKLIKAIEKNDLVFAYGPAGTGKTFISVALAVKALKNKEVRRIIITRPAVEAGEHLGFLPGDLEEKIDPYLRPIFDSLRMLLPTEKMEYYRENGIIEIAPLAYMRGRTLDKAFVILDEAQNTTTQQMKMFLTRMGKNAKIVVSGDVSQIDLPKHQKSGLKEAVQLLRGVEGIGFVEMSSEDIIRHKLVAQIVKAYDKASERKKDNNPN